MTILCALAIAKMRCFYFSHLVKTRGADPGGICPC